MDRIRSRVEAAFDRSIVRQGVANALLHGEGLTEALDLDPRDLRWLAKTVDELGLSFRAFDMVRRIARTIADLEGEDRVGRSHLEEAVSYRRFDRE